MTTSRPARAALGTKRARPAKTSRATATAAAAMIPDARLTAPAWWLIAERVNEPEPGMQLHNEPTMLATPSARHWRLKSIRSRVREAIDLATASASRRPSRAMASALPLSRLTHDQLSIRNGV